jgi:hypothetical protein
LSALSRKKPENPGELQSTSAGTAGREKQSEFTQDARPRRAGGVDGNGIRRRQLGDGDIDSGVQDRYVPVWERVRQHRNPRGVSGKAKLLGSPRVECNVLFSSTTVGALGAPQIIKGHFTYTNCTGCGHVQELEGTTAEIEVLRTGHETASVTGEAEILVTCFGIECEYTGEGLAGTARGPLLATQANGEVALSEQVVHGLGSFCPPNAKLDILMTPLTATYISS